MKEKVRMVLTLTFTGVFAAVTLGAVNAWVSPVIESRGEALLMETAQNFFPGATDMEKVSAEGNNPVSYEVVDEEGEFQGYVLEDHTTGYQGDIKYYVGIDGEGQVEGINVVEHQETPGIGDVIEEEEFQEQFMGKHYGDPVAQEADAATGATVSSQAMINGIQGVLDYSASNYFDEEEIEINLAEVEPGTYTGEGTGQMDVIKVEVTIGEGSIEEVKIVEQDETPDYFADAEAEIPDRIKEAQQLDEVDAVSGATGSSQGIIEATRNALAEAME